MLRSMFSAVSGLRSHQTMMDVTGNNVSNVNTAGYKSSRTTFQETLTQVVRGGTAAGMGGQGGVNPMQLGLGSQVGATDMVFSQGASQVTGRATDVAIQGDGFFVVQSQGQTYYTRAGAFSVDAAGFLVAPGGELLQGRMAGAAPDSPLTSLQLDLAAYSDIAIGGDGSITGRDATGALQQLGQIGMARFANPNGLTRAGNGLFAVSPNSGAAQIGTPGEAGYGTLQSGTLEMSNVDLAQEFTNLILAQRGFQANARTITASDELLQELVNLKR
ncbi:flagellar hook-basal body complex protein [Nitriliruptoraceae bacterium ZYF776]|nr:flagellar hook-basal body complex protein [Profundirhabdus halotolerans]